MLSKDVMEITNFSHSNNVKFPDAQIPLEKYHKVKRMSLSNQLSLKVEIHGKDASSLKNLRLYRTSPCIERAGITANEYFSEWFTGDILKYFHSIL